MTVFSTSDFDPEFTAYLPGIDIEIEKVGGGTLGRAYEGYWHFRIVGGEEIHEMYTGTPKNHYTAAEVAAGFMQALRDEP